MKPRKLLVAMQRAKKTKMRMRTFSSEIVIHSTRYEIYESKVHNYVVPDQHVDTFFGNEENEGSKRDTDETSGSLNPKILASKGGETVREMSPV